MHKNLQFCDICGHVVVEKLLFTSTYWECKNCEEKEKSFKLEPGEKIVMGQDFPDMLLTHGAINPYGTPAYILEPFKRSEFLIPVTPMKNIFGPFNPKIHKVVDVYKPTGRMVDNGQQYQYEYVWDRREG